MSGGLASARVGLGSPSLNLRRDWLGSNGVGKGGLGDLGEEGRIAHGLVDSVSGLPSPPNTDSDIALPAGTARTSGRPTLTTAPSASKIPVPTMLRRTSSTRSGPPTQRASSISSTQSSGESSRKILRPKQSPHIPRSTSSSSSNILSPGSAHDVSPAPRRSSGGSTKLLPRDTSRTSLSSSTNSQTRRLPRDASRSSLSSSTSSLARPTQDSTRLSQSPVRPSPSPTKSRHHHSPSSPLPLPHSPERTSRRSSHRLSGNWENGLVDDPITEEPQLIRRVSAGDELDERIRQAEEKIRQSTRRSRNPLAYELHETSPSKGTMRRGHSYEKEQTSPVVDSSTLRRNATLASARSPLTHRGEMRDETEGMRAGGDTWKRSTASSGSIRTPGRDNVYGSGDLGGEDKDRSGGSGSSGRRKPLPMEFRGEGLFTPSPKAVSNDKPVSTSRFNSISRMENTQSPSALLSKRHNLIDGLERSASVSDRLERRQWQDSLSGLPRSREPTIETKRDFPTNRPFSNDHPRAESVVNGLYERDRHHHRSSLRNMSSLASTDHLARQPRSALGPGDSVSAIGSYDPSHTSSRNPLDVIRRIEAQRDEHNRVWDVERGATAMGDNSSAPLRPQSRFNNDITPSRVRATTSMASMRGDYPAPRTAPIERYSRPAEDSPLLARGGSRLSHIAGPSSEPRQMRSSTSLGGRSSASLDVHSATTEHGRLLFEACRAVGMKIPHELLVANPELLHTLSSTSRSSESVNASLRHAIGLASRIGVDAELDPARVHEDIQHLTLVLREAARTSDQAIRDLTRIMLDLPKALRSGSNRTPHPSSPTTSNHHVEHDPTKRSSLSSEIPRRWQASSPVTQLEDRERRSVDLSRPTTSMLDYTSPTQKGRIRDSLPPNFGTSGRQTSISSFVGRVRNFGASTSSPRRTTVDGLAPIKGSPPSFPPKPTPISPLRTNLPTSPDCRLRKKASATSTHTVKGIGSNFFPPQVVRTTTAVSAITAGFGVGDGDGEYEGMPMTSRSVRPSMDWADGSPGSRGGSTGLDSGSYHTAEDEGDGVGNAISVVEQNLVKAARYRDEGGYGEIGKGAELSRRATTAGTGMGVARKGSVSERFMATLRRGA